MDLLFRYLPVPSGGDSIRLLAKIHYKVGPGLPPCGQGHIAHAPSIPFISCYALYNLPYCALQLLKDSMLFKNITLPLISLHF